MWPPAVRGGHEVRIVVDRGRCSGMGICESLAPEHFEVGDDGVMRLLREEADTPAARSAGLVPGGIAHARR
ncbi:MAG: ferredoxin [Lapillicoccus sp.]